MPPGVAKSLKKERKLGFSICKIFFQVSLIVSISPPKFSFRIHFLEYIKHRFFQAHYFGFPVGIFPLLLNSLSHCFFLLPLFCLLVHRLF